MSTDNKQAAFLNSFEWRRFQESVGNKIFELDSESYLIKLTLPFGKCFLYSSSPNSLNFLDKIKKIGNMENAIFFKYEPMIMKHETWNVKHLQKAGFKLSNKPAQPQRTQVVDLTKSEEELLKAMHQKTRYNIKIAARNGVEVKISDNVSNFWEILQKTAERDKFYTHTKEYYDKLLKLENVKLFSAQLKDRQIAFATAIFFENTVTYLHGASDDEYKKYMAPHLLHWEIMKYAKEKGFLKYDFWGIDEKKWPGVTRFKKSFGGKTVEYVGSCDYPLQRAWYAIYKSKEIYR